MKENRRTTVQVIEQVEGGFRFGSFRVSLSKTAINKYVANNIEGEFPISRGYCGLMPTHPFQLVVLAVESHIQFVQVNSVSLERNEIIRMINKCCGVVDERGGRLKTSLFDQAQAMRATSVSLNAAVMPPVEERCLRWTTSSNLLSWFRNFRAYLLENDFARKGRDGDALIFDEGMLLRIVNVNETEISVDGSKTRPRPALPRPA